MKEAGSEVEIEFSLTAAPTSEVLVHLQTNLDRVELTQESLVFNSETWDVPQIVGIRALADWSVDAQVDFLITAVFDTESEFSFRDLPHVEIDATVVDRQFSDVKLLEDDELVAVLAQGSEITIQQEAHRDGIQLVANDLAQTITIEPLRQTRGLIQIDARGGDDTVFLNSRRFTSIDGGDGQDRLIVNFDELGVGSESSFDLVSMLDNRVSGFEEIVVDNQANTPVVVDVNQLGKISGGTESLLVRLGERQVAEFSGELNAEIPVLVDDEFAQVFRTGDLVIHVINDNPWRNLANIYDVNRSGSVSPADALAIINAVDEQGFVDLPVITSLDQFDGFFYDVSGDQRLAPSDALMVIDLLSERSGRQPASEQVFGSDFLSLVENTRSEFVPLEVDLLNVESTRSRYVDGDASDFVRDQAISELFSPGDDEEDESASVSRG